MIETPKDVIGYITKAQIIAILAKLNPLDNRLELPLRNLNNLPFSFGKSFTLSWVYQWCWCWSSLSATHSLIKD